MKKIIKHILFFIFLIGLLDQSFAFNFSLNSSVYYINNTLKNKVDTFLNLKVKDETRAKQYIIALSKINVNKLDNSKKTIYNYLYYKLTIFWIKNSNAQTTQTTLTQSQNSSVTTNLSYTFSSDEEKNYITELQKYTKEFRVVDLTYNFYQDNVKYNLWINSYYLVETNKPISLYLNISWLEKEVLYKKWNNFYISKWGYKIEKFIDIEELKKRVKIYSESEDPILFEQKDWYYFANNLYKYSYFEIPSVGMLPSRYPDVKNISDSILLKKDGKYLLLINFEVKQAFKTALLDKITNKKDFLNYFWKDIYSYTWNDINQIMESIKTKTELIINWAWNDNEKILAIYSWITANVWYDDFSLDYINWKYSEVYFMDNVDKSVFSWLWAFKNKKAVCDGFSHLFLYMLNFSWIEDSKIETGEAYLSWNWIAHSWNKIWNDYYDSTWDIYSLWNKSLFKRYKIDYDNFFKLRRTSS